MALVTIVTLYQSTVCGIIVIIVIWQWNLLVLWLFVQYNNSEKILALAPWLTLVCIYFLFKSCTSNRVESPETNQTCYSGPRHEYAIVVDPSGTVQVGVRNAFSRSMNKIASTGSSVEAPETNEEEQSLLVAENHGPHIHQDPVENSMV